MRPWSSRFNKFRALGTVALLAPALLLTALPHANASVWRGVNRDIGEFVVYMDPSGITHEDGAEKVWVLYDFAAPRDAPRGFDEYRSLKEELFVRCGGHQYSEGKEIMYAGLHARGRIVETDTRPGERRFETAAPFTNARTIVDSACRLADMRRRGRGIDAARGAIATHARLDANVAHLP
jgi:hypothetical protein